MSFNPIFKNPSKGQLSIYDNFGNLITKLAPNQSIDLTPFIGYVNSLEEIFQRIKLNNHIVSLNKNLFRGKNYINTNETSYVELFQPISFIPQITMIFDSIVNAPASNLEEWNTFFNTDVNADKPFDYINISNNTVTLSGPTSMNLPYGLFYNNNVDSLISFVDTGIIKSLESYVFSNCSSLENIILKSATDIGGDGGVVFAYNTTLKNVELDSATKLGPNLFDGCTSLSALTLPSYTEVVYTTQFGNAFLENSYIQVLNLPNIITVGILEYNSELKSPFKNLINLREVNLPKAVELGFDIFYGCSNLTNIYIPNCTVLGEQSLRDCKLSSLDSETLTIIKGSALAGCPLSFVNLPNVTFVGRFNFADSSTLTAITLPNAITFEAGVFSGNAVLTDVVLPKATSIGAECFYMCSSLVNLEIPSCVNLGQSSDSDDLFWNIKNNNITLKIPSSLNNDGDVLYLQANNTVNIIN